MVKVLLIIFAMTLGGYLYRAGGIGKPYNTKWRDLGVPSVMIALMTFLNGWHWSLIACFGLMFAAQTTYFKKKGTDSKWYNWLFVGIAFSACMIPYAWETGHWMVLLYRTAIIVPFMIVWCETIGWDDLEESGRGAIQIVTLALL